MSVYRICLQYSQKFCLCRHDLWALQTHGRRQCRSTIKFSNSHENLNLLNKSQHNVYMSRVSNDKCRRNFCLKNPTIFRMNRTLAIYEMEHKDHCKALTQYAEKQKSEGAQSMVCRTVDQIGKQCSQKMWQWWSATLNIKDKWRYIWVLLA